MKNKDLLRLQAGLVAVRDLKGAKFAYAVAKNDKIISSEIEALQTGLNTPEIRSLIEAEADLLIEHCIKDEANNPVINNAGNVSIDKENLDKYNKARKKFDRKHEEVIKLREAANKEYKELLEAKCEITLHKIPESYLPAEISGSQLASIFEIMQ